MRLMNSGMQKRFTVFGEAIDGVHFLMGEGSLSCSWLRVFAYKLEVVSSAIAPLLCMSYFFT